jgi:hypothetical protein
MRIHASALCATLALSIAFVGCASEARPADAPPRVGAARALEPSYQDRGRDTLIGADRQMKDLQRLRDDSTDPFAQEVMTAQIDDLRVRSQKLMDEMTVGDARVHDGAIRADLSNLQRTMNGTANAERQAEPSGDGP